ncbi:sulfurtransferase TusA family protein [bacterium]|nr:sulfurtransferase TusA family protein [bacterium]MBU1614369.1 sulfurtransferase TusA family protein [bacterium]
MAEVEVIDACCACCLKTAGVLDKLKELEGDKVVEVVFDNPDMRGDLMEMVEEAECEIVDEREEDDEFHIRVKKKAG